MNYDNSNTIYDLSNYIPPSKPAEKSNLELWKKELTEKDYIFFDKLIANLIVSGDYVTYLGKTKRVYHSVYDTVHNEPTFTITQKKQWTTYVMGKFKSKDRFNSFIHMEKEATLNDYKTKELSFVNELHEFPLVVCMANKVNPIVYALDNNYSKKLNFLCSLHDAAVKKIIFNYLKLNTSLYCMKGVKSEAKVYNAFLEELSVGYHKIYNEPVLLSNKPNVFCLAYIPLNYKFSGDTSAWDIFTGQFVQPNMVKLFMSWVYSIIVENDLNRTVLWIHGDSQTAKSTVTRVLETYLNQFYPKFVSALSEKEDRFSLSAVIDARVVLYSDVADNNFFKRRDVKNLTGNDFVFIEEKFKSPYGKKIYSKILVTANYAPVIDKTADFEKSRLLYVKIDKKKSDSLKQTVDFNKIANEQNLLKQLPAFLYKCKKVYKELNNE